MHLLRGFPGGSVVKNPPASAGDLGLIPGSGRSSGEGNGNPLQYSCLGNPMGRGAWKGYRPWSRKELVITEWLKHTHTHSSSKEAELGHLPPSRCRNPRTLEQEFNSVTWSLGCDSWNSLRKYRLWWWLVTIRVVSLLHITPSLFVQCNWTRTSILPLESFCELSRLLNHFTL